MLSTSSLKYLGRGINLYRSGPSMVVGMHMSWNFFQKLLQKIQVRTIYHNCSVGKGKKEKERISTEREKNGLWEKQQIGESTHVASSLVHCLNKLIHHWHAASYKFLAMKENTWLLLPAVASFKILFSA